jgi:ROK family
MPSRARPEKGRSRQVPLRILVLDVGGTHVKVYPPGRGARIEIPTGPTMTPEEMVRQIRRSLKGVRFEAVSIGYPGLVLQGKIARDPPHLGHGWVGFDFERALGRPVQTINDAAMQALGSYRGGRMLFLGLGTGLGSAMIADGELLPMELGHLPWKKEKTYEDYVGEDGLQRLKRKKWQKAVFVITKLFSDALEPEYVILGGGNVRKLKRLPPGARAGSNLNAFTGGIRLWRGGGRAVHARSVAAAARRDLRTSPGLKKRLGDSLKGTETPPGPRTRS